MGSSATLDSTLEHAQTEDGGSSMWMGAIVGIGALLLGLGVWAYSALQQPATSRPKPAWLAVPKVTSQMADGRMLAMRVNLQLKRAADESALSPHVPAFASLIESSGSDLQTEQISDSKQLKALQSRIQHDINGYLSEQGVPQRVRKVDFQELVLLP